MPLNLNLQDFAKFAYGNGLLEGAKGGKGYLTLDKNGGIAKVFTHGGKAREFAAIAERGGDDFQLMKRGSDALRARLLQLAEETLGDAPGGSAKLAHVRALLTQVGTEGNGVGEKSLLSRKVVAQALSAIDDKVWTADVKRAAKDLTTNNLDTVSNVVLKDEIAAMKRMGAKRTEVLADFGKTFESFKVPKTTMQAKLETCSRALDRLIMKLHAREPSSQLAPGALEWLREWPEPCRGHMTVYGGRGFCNKNFLQDVIASRIEERVQRLVQAHQDLDDLEMRKKAEGMVSKVVNSITNTGAYLNAIVDTLVDISETRFEDFFRSEGKLKFLTDALAGKLPDIDRAIEKELGDILKAMKAQDDFF